MYFLIICEKKHLYYETFDDRESLEEHINSRKSFFHKKFKNHQAYIVKGEEIFTAKKHIDAIHIHSGDKHLGDNSEKGLSTDKLP